MHMSLHTTWKAGPTEHHTLGATRKACQQLTAQRMLHEADTSTRPQDTQLRRPTTPSPPLPLRTAKLPCVHTSTTARQPRHRRTRMYAHLRTWLATHGLVVKSLLQLTPKHRSKQWPAATRDDTTRSMPVRAHTKGTYKPPEPARPSDRSACASQAYSQHSLPRASSWCAQTDRGHRCPCHPSTIAGGRHQHHPTKMLTSSMYRHPPTPPASRPTGRHNLRT